MATGLRVWFAEYSISLAGRMEFRRAILAGIADSIYGVCFTNPGYFASEFCGKELQTLLRTRDSSRLIQIRLAAPPTGFANPIPSDVPTIGFTDCQHATAAILHTAAMRVGIQHLVVPKQDARLEWRFQGRRFSLDTQGWRVKQTVEIDSGGELSFERRLGLRMVHGTLTVQREEQTDPCLRDGTLDDAVYFERAFHFRGSALGEGRCDGLHLLRIHGFRQLGFTAYLKNAVARSYMIAYPQPQNDGSIAFAFSFRVRGSPRLTQSSPAS